MAEPTRGDRDPGRDQTAAPEGERETLGKGRQALARSEDLREQRQGKMAELGREIDGIDQTLDAEEQELAEAEQRLAEERQDLITKREAAQRAAEDALAEERRYVEAMREQARLASTSREKREEAEDAQRELRLQELEVADAEEDVRNRRGRLGMRREHLDTMRILAGGPVTTRRITERGSGGSRGDDIRERTDAPDDERHDQGDRGSGGGGSWFSRRQRP